MMKKYSCFVISIVVMLITALKAEAYDCQIAGIYYNLSEDKAIVTYRTPINLFMYSGKVEIPESITYYGKNYTVTQIGEMAFYGCTGLTSISIPNTITSIGRYAFAGCSSLRSIPLPNSITTIEGWAFEKCTSLSSITIPSSITYIATGAAGAFSGCSGISSVTFHCKSIGSWFSFLSSLYEITIGNEVESVGEKAFMQCTGLHRVAFGDNTTYIGSDAFYGTYWFDRQPKGLVYAGKVAYKYNGTMPENTKIKIVDGTIGIASNAFQNCSGLLSVSIPNSVMRIGNGAFSGCTNLFSVNIPENITSLGFDTFKGCCSLKSIVIPNSLTAIGSDAFGDCNGLNKVIVSDIAKWCSISFDDINSNPLYFAKHLCIDEDNEITNLTIPNGITHINDFAFAGYSSLKSLTIHNNIKAIGKNSFEGCSGLNKVVIPDIASWCSIKLTNEKSNPLYFSKHLFCDEETEIKNLLIPNGVTDISEYAFYGCAEITSLTLPESISTISSSAFEGCSGLWTIIFHCQEIDNWFANNTNIKKITLGNEVKIINDGAFASCSSLKTITLPNNIESIGHSAFSQDIFLYVNRDTTTTLLALWKAGYIPYDNTIYTHLSKIEPPYLSLFKKTQTTMILKLKNRFDGYTYEYRCNAIDSEYHPIYDDEISLIGLSSGKSHSIWLKVSNDKVSYETCWDFTTHGISPVAKITYRTASSLSVVGSYKQGDAMVTKETLALCKMKETTSIDNSAYYSSFSRSIKGDRGQTIDYYKNFYLIEHTKPIEGKETIFYGLNPSTDYYVVYSAFIESGAYTSNAWTLGTTETLTFSAQQPKVISAGNVIVGAESNLDDEETNVGFEWRRTDWTDEFASNTGGAYLYGGKMEGYIRNMYTEKLWKYRPYYESNSGNRYYGDWVGIDPTNTSYFEPTVYTYSTYSVSDNTAEVKGYAMRGTDNITSQGFLYWEASPQPSPKARVNRAPTFPANAKMVEAGGNVMIVKLDNLDFDTEYLYVAFVTTSENKTFYGEEQSFRTGAASQEVIDGIDGPTPSPSLVERGTIYDFSGRKLHALQKGLNIIRMSDGTSKKVMTK